VIGDGVKMDNLVQVGRNCAIGPHAALGRLRRVSPAARASVHAAGSAAASASPGT
jgi:UDP-3-O-[3-hydroxymyristoyl] glucosamine N-acyltransferase